MKIFISILLVATLLGLGNARPSSGNEINIIGGTPARQGEIPYILSLQVDGQQSCGASIIVVQNVTLAISAAHCTPPEELDKYNFTVVAGELKLSDRSGIEQRVQVTEVINHENYNTSTKRNDICLLFLGSQIQFNENVKPIELPPARNTSSGSIIVSGWGMTDPREFSPSDDLLYVEVPVVNDTDCARAYAPAPIFDDFLCAGKMGEGGADACQMDSGGPAVQDGKLVGIVSWGSGCGLAEYPGVYAETAFYLDWINENVASYKARNQ